MKLKCKLLLAFMLLSKIITAQTFEIHGRIIESETEEPIAFANITYNNGYKGVIATFDGRFTLQLPDKITELRISSVAFNPIVLTLNADNYSTEILIKLTRKTQELSEVTIRPGLNPAHRVIKKVIENRDKNNPEKVESFTYTSYNKMYFTLQDDTTLKGNQQPLIIDSLEKDTSDIKLHNYLNKQHLFLTEFVSERHFKFPDKNLENVISSKISGLNDPIFVLLATQMQSFSFYNEYVTLFDRNYINPISNGSTNRYFFVLEDTLFNFLPDTVFVISYRPLKGKNFDGLSGVLYINTNGYAVQNVIAEPAGFDKRISIKIQQQYEFIDNKQWFPTQLNTNLLFKNSKVKTRTRELYVIGIGKSYLTNININPDVTSVNFSNIELDVAPEAGKRDSSFWTQNRAIPLTKKDSLTYTIIDSIGKAKNLDKRMMMLEALLYGYIPIGGFNIDFQRLLKYNKFEGIIPGLGISTNPKIFSFASIGGFFSYGLKSEYWKYGGYLQLFPRWYSDTKLNIRYTKNVTETGGFSYLDDYTLNSTEYIRSYYINKMDKAEEKEMSFTFRTLQHFKINLYLNQTHKVFDNYVYNSHNPSIGTTGKLTITEMGIQMKFAYGEKFLKTPRGKLISLGTKYPLLWLNYKRGLDVFDGQISYNKYEAKISASFITKQFGKTQIQVKAGKITGDVPLSNTYSALGCYDPFPLDVENYFAAVRPGEFYSNEFAAIFFRQNFGPLLYNGKKFKPELHFVTNAGWGKLPNTWMHSGIDFNTMEKGYFESGILLYRLLNMNLMSLGVGAYYRYGYYTFAKISENLAYKLAFTYSL